MTISKIDPTLSIERLRFDKEGQYFDRKSERLAAKDFAHHLSAFANASGGIVAIGIEDDGRVTGVSAEKENIFRQAAFDYMHIPPMYHVEKIACGDENGVSRNILLFHIENSANEIIKLKTGEAYLRVGDASRRLSAEQFLALEYTKGIKSFEARIVEDATLDDLDWVLVEQYTKQLNPTVSSSVDVLKGRGLLKEKKGKI